MSGTIIALSFIAGGSSALMSALSQKRPLLALWWFGFLTVFDTAMAAWNLVAARWLFVGIFAVCAVVAAYEWRKHWNRRKRKRAAALAGAKSRARIQALVRKARETVRPRRVLRPVPGGTR